MPSFAVAEHTIGVPLEFTPVAPVFVHHVPVVTTCGGSAAAVACAELGGVVVVDGFVVVAPGVVVLGALVVLETLDELVVLDGCVVEVCGALVVVCGVFTEVSSAAQAQCRDDSACEDHREDRGNDDPASVATRCAVHGRLTLRPRERTVGIARREARRGRGIRGRDRDVA